MFLGYPKDEILMLKSLRGGHTNIGSKGSYQPIDENFRGLKKMGDFQKVGTKYFLVHMPKNSPILLYQKKYYTWPKIIFKNFAFFIKKIINNYNFFLEKKIRKNMQLYILK